MNYLIFCIVIEFENNYNLICQSLTTFLLLKTVQIINIYLPHRFMYTRTLLVIFFLSDIQISHSVLVLCFLYCLSLHYRSWLIVCNGKAHIAAISVSNNSSYAARVYCRHNVLIFPHRLIATRGTHRLS